LAWATKTVFSRARHRSAFSFYGLPGAHQVPGSDPSSVVTQCGTKTTCAPARVSERLISG
jgi:hypothetical protein